MAPLRNLGGQTGTYRVSAPNFAISPESFCGMNAWYELNLGFDSTCNVIFMDEPGLERIKTLKFVG